ncbi:hypothetical protein Dimus_025040 [Dionaea muscipula]
MQVELGVSRPSSAMGMMAVGDKTEKDEVRVKRKALKTVLEKCQRALELLSDTGNLEDDDDDDDDEDRGDGKAFEEDEKGSSSLGDRETDELCNLLKSRVECPDFLEKLESARVSVPRLVPEEGTTWDVVSENDLWEYGNGDQDEEDYVLVRQEDIVDGIACFMAAYLLSLKQTKDLNPNQLQDALRKMFSLKKKKGKLRKAWDGSKVIYNVASWSATALGIYQNPAIISAASTAFWASCRVISKLF